MLNYSKQLGGILGPSILAIIASEFPLIQPHLYDAQIPPVVYLSGTMFFIGGLAVVRFHNRWVRDWTVLITIAGWAFLLLGIVRMFAASAYLQGSSTTSETTFMVLESVLFLMGLIITIKSYSRK